MLKKKPFQRFVAPPNTKAFAALLSALGWKLFKLKSMARGVAAVPLLVKNIVPSYVATPIGPPGAAPPTPIPLPAAVWPNTPLSVVMLPAAVTCAKVGVTPPEPLAAAVIRP